MPLRGQQRGPDAVEAARAGDYNALLRMIKGGYDLDAPNPASGDTALHLAAFRHDARCVEALLVAGVKVNAANDMGNAPLHFATKSTETTALLLKHGALPNAANNFGDSATAWALRYDRADVVELLAAANPARQRARLVKQQDMHEKRLGFCKVREAEREAARRGLTKPKKTRVALPGDAEDDKNLALSEVSVRRLILLSFSPPASLVSQHLPTHRPGAAAGSSRTWRRRWPSAGSPRSGPRSWPRRR